MNTIDVWKQIFRQKKYLVIAVIVSLIFYLINVIILNYDTMWSVLNHLGFLNSLKFLITISIGISSALAIHSVISLIIVSILLGMLVSIISYKISIGSKPKSKKIGAIGTIGVFLAALAPGCAACGIGLIAALGLGGVILTILPFGGIEISILSIFILGFTVWKVSKGLLECPSCSKYMVKQQMKGGKKKWKKRRTTK